MALILADRVKETTTTTGTGTVTLAGAVTGYQSFTAIGDGNTTYYTIASQSNSEWEVGIGTYTSSGTTLSRTTVLSSSNAGSLVNFSSGTKDVFVTYTAKKAIITNDVGDVLVNQTYDQGTGVLQVTGQSTFNGAVTDKSLNLQGGNNLVTYSQDFTNAAWIKLATTVTANSITSPDGATTGDKLVETTANSVHQVSSTLTLSNAIYTFTAYIKAGERTTALLRMSDNSTGDVGVTINLATGVATNAGLSAGSWTAISFASNAVGNGWYRVSITGTKGGGSQILSAIVIGSNLSPYAGDGTSGIYIWGAQLELGTVASAYTPTTTAAITTTNNISVPSGQVTIGASSASSGNTSPLQAYSSSTNSITYQRVGTGKAWVFNSDAGSTYWYNLTDTVFGLGLTNAGNLAIGGSSFTMGGATGTGDTILTRDAANTLAQRNSTNAQTFRLYNTYTDASNYERLSIDWSTTANTATIVTQNAGSGSARTLAIGQDLYVNSVRVGLGGGNVSTNTAVGNGAMAATATGGYNSAFGLYALKVLTSGSANFAGGYAALQQNTTGSYNIGLGATALPSNTTGSYNTSVGGQSFYNSTIGNNNSGFGYNTLYYNTTASYLTAIGYAALYSNTTNVATLGSITGGTGYTNGTYTGVVMTLSSGSTAITYPTATIVVSGGAVTTVTLTSNGVGFKDTTTVLTAPAASIGGTGSGFSVPVATLASGTGNVAVGYQAGYTNSTGVQITTVGYQAGYANTTGQYLTSVGYAALSANTTGSSNTAVGNQSLYRNTTGANNSANGYYSLYTNTTGNSNTAFGSNALYLNSTGSFNSAVGINSLYSNTASSNTSFGYAALYSNTSGANNTALGVQAGFASSANANTTGTNNTYLGYATVGSAATNTNEMVIGYQAVGLGSNTTVIGNSSTTLTKTFGVIVGTNYTVATLPSASTSGVGARAFVTDALAPVFGSAVAGSGAVPVPVYSTGSAWNVG